MGIIQRRKVIAGEVEVEVEMGRKCSAEIVTSIVICSQIKTKIIDSTAITVTVIIFIIKIIIIIMKMQMIVIIIITSVTAVIIIMEV